MFKLDPEVQRKWNEARARQDLQRAVFANLSDTSLASTARFWMQHCQQPSPTDAGLIYDATLWYMILPEILRRLEER